MDASTNTCVEFLRPKTIPEQLVALGTVSQISDIQIKLQITGGIVCLVDRINVSQTYSELLRKYEASLGNGKPRQEPPKLSQLFQRGQQYVCKILNKTTRKGYAEAQDISATLDPTELQDGNIAATLFAIPNVPLQCAILSLEDHGYRVDVGFKNLTGFLNFDEAEEYCNSHNKGKKFSVGQIIRCCTKEEVTMTEEVRVIQLSMQKETLKQCAFSKEKVSQNVLTPGCILPGSVGYLIVMKVQKDGLIVNFLDEFSGFVSVYHLKDEWHDPKKNYKISDKLKCTVLYYNKTTNTFALSLKQKSKVKKTIKAFTESYHVGQVIKKAQFTHLIGLKSVNFRVGTGFKALANVRDALNEDVSTMTKDDLNLALDSTFQENSVHKCRIKSINFADLVLVLSLRQEFLDLSFVSVEELRPADFIEVTVKKHVRDGVVVSFGLNLRAIILNVHLKDYVSANSHKLYPVGKTIKCRVLKIDLDKQPPRVYMTNKEQLMDSQMTVIDSYDSSFRNETVSAIVAKLSHSGIIVELFNNVKGFIPKRFCSSNELKTVSDLFKVGQVVTCTVYKVEPENQSMSLGIIPIEKIIDMKKERKRALREQRKLKEISQQEQNGGGKGEERRETKLQQSISQRKRKSGEQTKEQNEPSGRAGADEQKPKKSRLERSVEAKLREEEIRETERSLMDPNRPAQSIPDFERLVLKSPNSGEVWIKYSKFFLDNVETEKARIVCRRALSTINFRLEKEKLKVWLHLVKIEAKYGGLEKLRAIIDEAAQTNDKPELFRKAAKVLATCGELDEAERLHELTLKLDRGSPEVWIDYVMFIMEQRKDLPRARSLFEGACKALERKPADLVHAKSRFAHFEFKCGDVERGKTLFENLLSENPKRKDLWKVYEGAIRKFGTRQLDTDEVRQQNEQILQRIALRD